MGNPMSMRRTVVLLCLIVYLLFLLDLALLQFPSNNPPPNFIPLHSIIDDWRAGGRQFVVNFVGNLVAFMPIGLIPPLIPRRRMTAWHVALFCLFVSAIIEVGQYVSGRRVADVDDLILNTLGGLLGYYSSLVISHLSLVIRHSSLSRSSQSTTSEERTGFAGRRASEQARRDQ
jgi:glycopeptide antibiotics resistance protein